MTRADVEEDRLGSVGAVARSSLDGRLDSFLLNRMDRRRDKFILRHLDPALTWNRLDLAIKLHFLEKLAADSSAFAQELYDAHIHAFSLGDFREPGNKAKVGAAAFRSAFEEILRTLRTEGFDPERSLIPMASDGSFINGGHRAACALFLRQRVYGVETGLPPVRYDYRFFRKRGMSDDLLEAAIMIYVERSPTARLALVQPGKRAARAELLLEPLVYKKKIFLSPSGAESFLRHLCSDASRSGSLLTSDGSEPKGFLRHSDGSLRLVAYVFDGHRPNCFDSGFSSLPDGAGAVFLPGCRQTCLDLTRMLLNDRSIQFLNRGHPDRFPSTSSHLKLFRDALERSGIPRESAVLGVDMVLAVSGVRETERIDFMSSRPLSSEVPSSVFQRRSIGPELDEIIQDPRRHFHHDGLKFIGAADALKMAASGKEHEDADALLGLAALAPRSRSRDLWLDLLPVARFRWSRIRRGAIHALARFGLRDLAKVAHDRLVRR